MSLTAPRTHQQPLVVSPAIIFRCLFMYVASACVLTASTAAVTVLHGSICGLRTDSVRSLLASMAMSGSPVCKTLSSSSYFLHRLSDQVIVTGKFV